MKKEFIDKLYNAAKSQNRDSYIDIKYSKLNEGDEVIFKEKDFTGLDLRGYALPFTRFDNCLLDNCKLAGLPIEIVNCQNAGIDVRGSGAIILANNSNFTNCIWDEKTELGPSSDGFDGSVFTGCIVSKEFKDHFKKQGVIFED